MPIVSYIYSVPHLFHDSRSSRQLVGRSEFPSSYYIAWLAVLSDEYGREAVTPFSFTSIDLCNLAPLISLAALVPPSLHGFASNRPRHNDAAARMNRFGPWLVTVYNRNFNNSFVEALKGHLAKVIYIQGRPATRVLESLKAYPVAPIILVDTETDRRTTQDAGHEAHVLSSLAPEKLRLAISTKFSIPCDDLRRRGLSEGDMLPARFVEKYPDGHRFNESNLRAIPRSGLKFLEPNEILVSVLRGLRYPQSSSLRRVKRPR